MTTAIATLIANDKGYITRREAKKQIRAAATAKGLTLGLFESNKGKSFKAQTEAGDIITAERKVGSPVLVRYSTKAIVAELEETVEAIEAELEETVESLADMENLGLDQLGELLNRAPKDGGLTVGKMRAMLKAAGEVPPKGRVKRAVMVEAVTMAVLGVTEGDVEDRIQSVLPFARPTVADEEVNF
jgi:hypothetical protein